MQEEDEDEYTLRIKKTGCYDQYMKLLDCQFEKKDFRVCKDFVMGLKTCMAKYQKDNSKE